jgi:predicted permease
MRIRQLRGWLARLFSMFNRARREREFAEELESHLAIHIEDNLSAGISPEEARRQALIKLGGMTVTQELHRERSGLPMFETLWQDLRFGLRILRKNPGVTLIAVLTLAIGIGANAAIFSLFDALMLRRLPVQQPTHLVLFKRVENSKRTAYDLPHPIFERLRDRSPSFSAVSANWLIERAESADTPGADPGRVRVGMASGNYFSTLGVQAIIGRMFSPDDNRIPAAHPVAVISHSYWERRFGQATDIVGRTLTMSGTTFTIIGVTPQRFNGEWVGRPADLWVPFMMASQVMPEVPGGPARFPALIIGRLKPGVIIEQAQAAAQLTYQQLLMEDAGSNITSAQRQFIAQRRIALEPAANGHSEQRQVLLQPMAILAGMSGLMLLAVCANVANLLLARSVAREREIAVRKALGAPRWRIVRQLLTESLLLAVLGNACGLLFSVWGKKTLSMMLMAGPLSTGVEDNSIALDLRLDVRVIAFSALLSILTSLIFGLAPAWNSSKSTLSLKTRGSIANRGGGRFSLSNFLVSIQVALSLILLIGAGLFVRSLQNLRSQDIGFDRDHLLLVWAAPARTGRKTPELLDLAGVVKDKLSELPGVKSVSISTGGLLDGNVRGGQSEALQFQGSAPKPGQSISALGISPHFFTTVGLPLIAGRDFNEQDTEQSPKVAIVSESMARFYLGNVNPIGKRFNARGGQGFPIEIVGVVKDAKLGTPRDQRVSWYFPYRQFAGFMRVNWCIAVRTSVDLTATAASVRRSLRDLDPNLPILKVNTLEDQMSGVLVKERLIAVLSGFFGILAVFLSCLGIYGVISCGVARRTNEIGIRMALGATPADVIRLILKQSFWMVVGGIALGVPAAMMVARLISSLLFNINPIDPLTLVSAIILIIAVASAAALSPARKATKIDPLAALRHE